MSQRGVILLKPDQLEILQSTANIDEDECFSKAVKTKAERNSNFTTSTSYLLENLGKDLEEPRKGPLTRTDSPRSFPTSGDAFNSPDSLSTIDQHTNTCISSLTMASHVIAWHSVATRLFSISFHKDLSFEGCRSSQRKIALLALLQAATSFSKCLGDTY